MSSLVLVQNTKSLPLVACYKVDDSTDDNNMKDTCDVTCYTLLEATGDSETDCNPTKGDEYAYEIDIADGDAQSCSYNESDTCDAVELDGYDESLNADDEDDKKAGVYGTSYCEDDEMQEHHKSCVSDDSSQELVDEMEKNRLFWEACLAS